MKPTIVKIITLMLMMIFINCIHGVSEPISKDRIEDSVRRFGKYTFVIKFSNIIYEIDGKEIKIPIFRGNMGDIAYKELYQYFIDNNFIEKGYSENGFVIETKKGEVKKTFHEFLRFYQKNLFKDVGVDVNRPTKIDDLEPGRLRLIYYFKVKGIVMVIRVTIYTTSDVDTDKIKSVFDINNIDENFEDTTPYFYFEIFKAGDQSILN